MSMFCVKCKRRTNDLGARGAVSRNGRSMVKAQCSVCGTIKNQFVSGSAMSVPAGRGRKKKGGNILRSLAGLFF